MKLGNHSFLHFEQLVFGAYLFFQVLLVDGLDFDLVFQLGNLTDEFSVLLLQFLDFLLQVQGLFRFFVAWA